MKSKMGYTYPVIPSKNFIMYFVPLKGKKYYNAWNKALKKGEKDIKNL